MTLGLEFNICLGGGAQISGLWEVGMLALDVTAVVAQSICVPLRTFCTRLVGFISRRRSIPGPQFNRRLTLVSRMGLSYRSRSLTEEEGPFYS